MSNIRDYLEIIGKLTAAKNAYDGANADLARKETVLRTLMKNYLEWHAKTLELKNAADHLIAAHDGGTQFFQIAAMGPSLEEIVRPLLPKEWHEQDDGFAECLASDAMEAPIPDENNNVTPQSED